MKEIFVGYSEKVGKIKGGMYSFKTRGKKDKIGKIFQWGKNPLILYHSVA